MWRALLVLPLAGCAVLTEPMRSDPVAEQARCLESAWCRVLINDQPAWTVGLRSDRRECTEHAKEIARQAREAGLATFFVMGTIRGGEWHAVAVVAGEGGMFAFDNGAMSASPIPFDDLGRHMTVRMMTGEPAALTQPEATP